MQRPTELKTDGEGRFRAVGLEDAPHRVCAFAPLAAGQDRFGAAARTPRAVRNDVRPAKDPVTIRVEASAMASGWIEGSLLLPEGSRSRAMVSLYPTSMTGSDESAVPRERLAAGQTTFRLGPLPAGAYNLLVTIEGFENCRQNGLRLEPDATLRLPPCDFAAQQPLQLVLRCADGRAVTGATVRLVRNVPHLACIETAAGCYQSPPMGNGPWKATVRGPDIAPAEVEVARAASGPTVLVLRAGTRVDVHVQPPTPRPRWIGTLFVMIRDAQGSFVVREAMRIDTGSAWHLPLGLFLQTFFDAGFSLEHFEESETREYPHMVALRCRR